MSRANLNFFEADPDKFLLRSVTVVKYGSIISSKDSNNNINNGSTLAHPSAGKVIASIFGMLMV